MAGSHDDHPPKLLGPNDYIFAAIAEPCGHFRIYRSSRTPDISATEVARRLRDMADKVDTTPGETA